MQAVTVQILSIQHSAYERDILGSTQLVAEVPEASWAQESYLINKAGFVPARDSPLEMYMIVCLVFINIIFKLANFGDISSEICKPKCSITKVSMKCRGDRNF